MSVFIIFAITVGPPRIGVAATIGIVIAGNLVSAAAIDRYGLFGQEVIPLDRWRLLGLAARGRRRALAVPSVSTFVRPAARASCSTRTTASCSFACQSGHRPAFWTTPAAGSPAESLEDAIRRELREETGLEAELGPLIWTRREVCLDRAGDRPARSSSSTRAPEFEPRPDIGVEGLRRKTSTSFAGGRSRSSRPRTRSSIPRGSRTSCDSCSSRGLRTSRSTSESRARCRPASPAAASRASSRARKDTIAAVETTVGGSPTPFTP